MMDFQMMSDDDLFDQLHELSCEFDDTGDIAAKQQADEIEKELIRREVL